MMMTYGAIVKELYSESVMTSQLVYVSVDFFVEIS